MSDDKETGTIPDGEPPPRTRNEVREGRATQAEWLLWLFFTFMAFFSLKKGWVSAWFSTLAADPLLVVRGDPLRSIFVFMWPVFAFRKLLPKRHGWNRLSHAALITTLIIIAIDLLHGGRLW